MKLASWVAVLASSLSAANFTTSSTVGIELAYQEIYDVFADSTRVLFKSDGGSGTATCPTGQKIVWGFRYHFSTPFDSTNSCAVSNNRHCEVGATSCSFSSACRPGSADENGILILCSSKTIPTSKAYSLATTGQAARTASCGDPNERVIWGFSYHHMKDYDDPTNNPCMKANYGICDTPFSTSCSTQKCPSSDGVVMIYLLCAQGLYADAVEQLTEFQDIVADGREYVAECNIDKPVQLTGVTLSFAESFTTAEAEEATRPGQKICNFDVDSTGTVGDCTHRFSDTPSDDESFVTTLCGPPRPSVAATAAPSRSPTKLPTSSPTKFPTVSPTKLPTSSPTKLPTSSPNNLPTISPTRFPTLSPNSHPTQAPTTSPVQNGNTTVPITPEVPTASPTSLQTSTEESQDSDELPFALFAAIAGVGGAMLFSGVIIVVRRTKKKEALSRTAINDDTLAALGTVKDDHSHSFFSASSGTTDRSDFSYNFVDGVPVAEERQVSVHLPVVLPRKLSKNKVMVRPESRDGHVEKFATNLALQTEAGDDTLPRNEKQQRILVRPPPGLSPIPPNHAHEFHASPAQPRLTAMLKQQPELKSKIRSMFSREKTQLQFDNPQFGIGQDEFDEL